MRSLIWRGYQPLRVTRKQEVKNLFDHAIISALIVLDTVSIECAQQLCLSLRTTNRRTPIVVMLSPDNCGAGIGLLDSGADHYVIQPAQIDELLHKLHALTRRTRRTGFSFFPTTYAK
ncbi:response regulator transcription factor [Litoreibacter janthinus]|nr:response regulator transcription factor [Litoreibacter janthinus]